jgi:hypothetical protein
MQTARNMQLDRPTVAAILIANGVGLAGSAIVHYFMKEDPAEENKQLYADMRQIVEESKLPHGETFVFVKKEEEDIYEPQEPQRVVFKQRERENKDLETYIRRSLYNLELAKDSTTCNICKKELGDTAKTIRQKTQFIVDAERKAKVMGKLRSDGIIKNGSWYDLDDDEKELVVKGVRDSYED